MKLSTLLATLLFAAPAMADQGYLTVSKHTLALDGVALNAAAATRTVTATLTHDGASTGRPVYSKLLVVVDFTYAAASTVTDQFTCSLDGTNYGRRTSSSTVLGATTRYAEPATYTTNAASAVLTYEYDVRGCKAVQILFGGASAGASDLVDVTWTAVAGS